MGMDVAVKVAATTADFTDLFALRQRVFIDEQKVDISEEFDEYDAVGSEMAAAHAGDASEARFVEAKCVYVLARAGGVEILGTARMIDVPEHKAGEQWGKVGRVAVEKSARGLGVGRAMMGKLEELARLKGLRGVTLGAQLTAQAFYERLGYTALGDEFMDGGMPHIKCEKKV